MIRPFTAVAALAITLGSSLPPRRVLALDGDDRAAAGETPDDDRRSEALDLFEQSRKAYREGAFSRAADLLREAYDLYPAPDLLFNLGRTEESAGHDEAAVKAYVDYLEAASDAPDRGAIEKRIANIRRRIVEADEARRRAESAEDEARRYQRSSLLWPALITGAGVAGIGTGAVFAGLAKLDEAKARDERAHDDAFAAYERGKRNATIANVALIAGGMVAAGGLTWLIIDLVLDASPTSATLRLLPTIAGARLDVTF